MSDLHFISTIALIFILCSNVCTLSQPSDSSSLVFLPSEEDSYVALDHSGILSTEFVSLLEETEFTILINAYPAPKVQWLKDGKAISENYFTLTKTMHLEGNR